LEKEKKGFLGLLKRYHDVELRYILDGQFIKITGYVTCGNISLELSYQKVPRCVYISSELYEYKKWGRITWGSTYTRKYVADFYITNFKSRLRELVKTRSGAKIAPLMVEPTTIVDATNDNKELPQNCLH